MVSFCDGFILCMVSHCLQDASSEYSKRYSHNSRETHTREEFTTPLCLRVLTTTTTAYIRPSQQIIIRTVDNDATQIRDNLANNINGF
jgi:hypothetical protein